MALKSRKSDGENGFRGEKMVEIDFQRSFQTFGFKPLVVGFAWFQMNWDNDPSPCNWPAGPMCGCFTEYIRVYIYIYIYIYREFGDWTWFSSPKIDLEMGFNIF